VEELQLIERKGGKVVRVTPKVGEKKTTANEIFNKPSTIKRRMRG
jgi:hypothetical protein